MGHIYTIRKPGAEVGHISAPAITADEIRNSRDIAEDAKDKCIEMLPYINRKVHRLFTHETSKLAKSNKENPNLKFMILYLAPHNQVSERSVCPMAKANGCFIDCLGHKARLGMPTGKRAQYKRTVLMLLRPMLFRALIVSEIQNQRRTVKDQDFRIRMNGTSDLSWNWLYSMFPTIPFYGYTKVARVLYAAEPNANVSITFSASNKTEGLYRQTVRMIQRGHNVAFALNTKQLKGEWKVPAWFADADKNDDRTADKPNTVWGGALLSLVSKGSHKKTRARIEALDNDFFWNRAGLERIEKDLKEWTMKPHFTTAGAI
jgi:hypothetical protein